MWTEAWIQARHACPDVIAPATNQHAAIESPTGQDRDLGTAAFRWTRR